MLRTILLMVTVSILGCGERTPEEIAAQKARECTDPIMAYFMSRDFVERQLQSPSTADFPSYRDSGVQVTYNDNCSHSVSAYVDAENAFGGVVRRSYLATVRFDMDSTWTLEGLKFE